jgi:hypothetical protein
MINAIVDSHILDQERIDALQATDVVAINVGPRSTLVMRIDTALATKVMLGNPSVELIEAQAFLTLDDANTGIWHGCDDGTFPATDGAVAAKRINNAIRQIKLKNHSTTMATETMLG